MSKILHLLQEPELENLRTVGEGTTSSHIGCGFLLQFEVVIKFPGFPTLCQQTAGTT